MRKGPETGEPAALDSAAGSTRILTHTTAADRGLVETPLLAPHLEARPIGDDAVLLVSETSSTALYGRRYVDLLPLVDGVRSRHAIAAALADRHGRIEVQTALVSLASKGHVVSAEFAMPRSAAAFWCALGVSPRAAEERLGAARVAVAGDGGGRLGAALETARLTVAAEEPTLAVVVTADYLDPRHAETDRRHRASGLPWILVRPHGLLPLFGPVFRPRDEDAPCLECLAHRLRANREVENFLRTTAGDDAAIRPRALLPPFAGAAESLAAAEIARWIVVGEQAPLHRHALSVECRGPGVEHHPVMRRPQCPVCGDPALRRPDRPVAPVRLGPSPKTAGGSGGPRSAPPEETVRRHRHLVSPISGVVTGLQRTTDPADPWLHVWWAGSNLALKTDSLLLLRNNLRSKSSGKGSTPAQAEASALCEAIERHSGVWQGDEIRRRARFDDFADGEAIHPNDVMRFSEAQYDRAQEINARGERFNRVPARFDPTVEMDWTPVWSLTADRPRHLPTQMLYYSVPVEGGTIWCGPDSNGCAAGNTREEAILQGFFELVERDAFACWWYNRLALPEVDLDAFDDPWLAGARRYYAAARRELWVLDVTHDLGIPVFVSVSRRTDKEAEDILFSAGAHLDPHVAALRAVAELNQSLPGVRDADADGGGYAFDDPESLRWWKNARLADHRWLAPDGGAARRGPADYPVPATADLREDVELCRARVEELGLEFLVLDQTRPDIGLPVTKTIVPGLRHFWPRFAPGRLYDVPVRMGWRGTPTAEADLNPVAVFI